MILEVGLVQPHYGCTLLLGDYYQPRLAQWIDPVNLFSGLYVITLDRVALYRIMALLAPRTMILRFYAWFRRSQKTINGRFVNA